jgi:O-antigen/teichoic acid export membrane protein
MVTAASKPSPAAAGRSGSVLARVVAFTRPAVATERSLFIQRVGGTFTVRVVLVVIGFLTSIATARLLGPYGRGIYGAAIVLVTIASQFGNFGMHVSSTYYVAGDRSLLPRLFSNSLLVSLLGGSLISLLVLLLFRLRPSWAPVNGVVLDIALLLIPLTLCVLLLQNLLLGVQEVKWFNISDVSGKVAFLAPCLIFAFALHHWTAEYVMVIALFSVVLTVAIGGYRLLALVGRLVPPDLSLLRRQSGYGFKSYIVCLAGYAVLKADILMVKQMAGAVAAGYYSLASSMTDYVYMFPSVVGMILFPMLTGTGNPVQRWRRARKTMAGVAGIMAVFSAGAAVMARPMIAIVYGRDFLPALPAFLILCVAIVFYGANTVLSIYFAASGLPWFAVWIWPAAALLNIGLNLYAIAHWGIVGAAMTSLVTYGSLFLVQFGYAGTTAVRQTETAQSGGSAPADAVAMAADAGDANLVG